MWFCIVGYSCLLLGRSLLAVREIRRQRRLLQGPSSPSHSFLRALTVAQPILSGDPRLGDRLRACVENLPSSVTFIWLVDSADTAAIRVAREVATSHPNISILHCDEAPATTNPKSWKLQKALARCYTEFFCVLDDDTVVDLRGLRDAEIHLQYCDLYTGLPRYEVKGGVWSLLLAHFVNNNAILTYLPLLEFCQPVSINGMFYIVRTSAWSALGGFSPLFNEICDDYAVRCQAHSNGWRIAQGSTPHHVHTTVKSCRDYVAIQHRWNLFAVLLLLKQPTHLKATLTIILALPPMLLWGSLWGIFVSKSLCVASLLLLALRHFTLAVLHRVAFQRSGELSPVISIAAELLQPFHFTHAVCAKTIRWRNKVIHVSTRDGFKLLQEVQS